MNKRIHILLLLSIALATGRQFASADAPETFGQNTQNPGQNNSNSITQTQALLSGGIENNNGQLRLNLANGSSREFRGVVIIGIGNDSEQREIGQLEISLSPQETKLMKLSGVSASGNQFSIRIFDLNGALVFYKIAPIKNVSDPTPGAVVAINPVANSKRKTAAASSSQSGAVSATPVINNNDAAPVIAEVTIKARLLGGQSETDPFVLAFEMTAPRPIQAATLHVSSGKFKDRKPASIKQNLTVEFKLPDQLDSERVSYELTAKDGRVIVKGELDLEQLMAEDIVTVTEIRTDKASYEAGEQVQLTVLLEGKSPNGFRLEAQAKDGDGNVIFQDQVQSGANNQINTHAFTLTLPRELTAPVVFEFKIYDHGTGLLSDSGEREIPVTDAKRRP